MTFILLLMWEYTLNTYKAVISKLENPYLYKEERNRPIIITPPSFHLLTPELKQNETKRILEPSKPLCLFSRLASRLVAVVELCSPGPFTNTSMDISNHLYNLVMVVVQVIVIFYNTFGVSNRNAIEFLLL